jgi:hypothetical protein
MRRRQTTRIAIAALLTSSAAALAQPVTDREKLIDIQGLKEAMQKATEPIAGRIQASNLRAQFGRVNEVLSQERVDKQELITALKGLEGEIAVFTEDWDGEVADPLWDAQEIVSSTIDRVRRLLATGSGGEPSQRTKQQLEKYDARLQQLALAIESEPDELRKERLKVVFANVRSLRDVVERSGAVDLSSAREAIYVKTIRALAALEAQLTNATFEMEQVRLVLAGEREFIGNYVALLEGLIEAESLAKMLSSVDSDGAGIGGLSDGLGELTSQMSALGEEMDVFVEALAESIEMEATSAGERSKANAAVGLDIDAEIAKYAAQARQPKTPPTGPGAGGGSNGGGQE